MTGDDRPGAGVVWARVEDGFHVASARGVFLGYIDREADGSYLAYNGRSRLVGRFPAWSPGWRPSPKRTRMPRTPCPRSSCVKSPTSSPGR
ncbi:hypothetical protein ACF044_05875 [Microbacterium sp. NPDC016588]